jgi:S-adenosylmethionine:tRNA ribosyltransferase-isomerase
MLRSDELDFGLTDVNVPKQPRPLSEHRLLVYSREDSAISDSIVTSIGDHLESGDLLVFNNSRVLPVSLYLDDERFVLICEPHLDGLESVRVICPFKPEVGETLRFPFAEVELLSHEPGWDVYRADIRPSDGSPTLPELLEEHGQFPTPIYIRRQPTVADEAALQNFYATVDGSIAPPDRDSSSQSLETVVKITSTIDPCSCHRWSA